MTMGNRSSMGFPLYKTRSIRRISFSIALLVA